MKMIELTDKNNNKLYINTDKIEAMSVHDNFTTINVSTGTYCVKETPKEILNKINCNEMNMLYEIRNIVSDRLAEIFASIK